MKYLLVAALTAVVTYFVVHKDCEPCSVSTCEYKRHSQPVDPETATPGLEVDAKVDNEPEYLPDDPEVVENNQDLEDFKRAAQPGHVYVRFGGTTLMEALHKYSFEAVVAERGPMAGTPSMQAVVEWANEHSTELYWIYDHEALTVYTGNWNPRQGKQMPGAGDSPWAEDNQQDPAGS